MLLPNLILLINVTFSTPTGHSTSLRRLFAPEGFVRPFVPRLEVIRRPRAVRGAKRARKDHDELGHNLAISDWQLAAQAVTSIGAGDYITHVPSLSTPPRTATLNRKKPNRGSASPNREVRHHELQLLFTRAWSALSVTRVTSETLTPKRKSRTESDGSGIRVQLISCQAQFKFKTVLCSTRRPESPRCRSSELIKVAMALSDPVNK